MHIQLLNALVFNAQPFNSSTTVLNQMVFIHNTVQ
jgi:hypothetical protein